MHCQYSKISQPPRQQLTSKNIKARKSYIKFVNDQWKKCNFLDRATTLYNDHINNKTVAKDDAPLQQLDEEITQVLLQGEKQCCKPHINCNPWSPKPALTGKQYTYWKRKWNMVKKGTIKWHLLHHFSIIEISNDDHWNLNVKFIKNKLRDSRKQWQQIRKDSVNLRLMFLQDLAEDYATRYNIQAEKVLKAILLSEQSKLEFLQIRQILGHKKDRNPLTEATHVDPISGASQLLTDKTSLEEAILHRNQVHARQALATPFITNPILSRAINHTDSENHISQMLDGIFITDDLDAPLTTAEQPRIKELQQTITNTIDIHIKIEDFIRYFKKRKECTASSFSNRHMGRYKVICQLAQKGQTQIAETLVIIMNLSIQLATPLHRWQRCSQIMLDKGKGNSIVKLRIIHLCEADLNFALHVHGERDSFIMP